MAATSRTSTLIVFVPPRRSNSCSCSTRSSLGCSSGGMSPTSSRNSVPWWASSKRPTFWLMAPVKAPFSWPNSSLSSSPVGMAAQLSLTKVRSRRGLRSCRARAMSSLPVPVSPRMSTVEPVGATVSTCFRTRRRAALSPTISPKLCSVRTSSSR